jgi:hypothetical protein
VLVPWAKLKRLPTTYSPGRTEEEANVIGWMSGVLHPPWNWVRDEDAPAVLVPVFHALVPEALITDAREVLFPNE